MVRPWNGNRVSVYKYMNKKNQWFVGAMNFKKMSHIRSHNYGSCSHVPFVERPGILGSFKMAEHSYPSSPHSKSLVAFMHRFNIVQTSRSQGQHLLKFPTLGAHGLSKSQPRPVVYCVLCLNELLAFGRLVEVYKGIARLCCIVSHPCNFFGKWESGGCGRGWGCWDSPQFEVD